MVLNSRNDLAAKAPDSSRQIRRYIRLTNLILELLDMGPQSITQYSKRDYQKGKRLAKKQNVLQRQFQADEPNRVWVSDVTCFKVNDKYLYVCVILDLFSRKAVAYRVSPKNSTYLITSAFR